MNTEELKTITDVSEVDPDFALPVSDNEVTEEDKHTGVYGLIVDAIQNTWETINRYNSYIATLNSEELRDQKVLNSLNNVLNNELQNASILMSCLAEFDEEVAEVIPNEQGE